MIARQKDHQTDAFTVPKETEKMTAKRTAIVKLFGAMSAIVAVGLLALVTSASAAVSLTLFDGGVFKANGEAATQAGSHPASAWTELRLSQEPKTIVGQPKEISTETLKDVIVELPAGLIGNPQAVPSCTIAQLNSFVGLEVACPSASQVGIVTLRKNGQLGSPGSPDLDMRPIFNMKAPYGTAGLLGFIIEPVPAYVSAGLRTGGDYGITASALNAPVTAELEGVKAEIWGVPADPSHNGLRPACLEPGTGHPIIGCNSPSPEAATPHAFFTLPTSCMGPVQTSLTMNTWEGSSISESFLSHVAGNKLAPIGNDGCASVPFAPTLEAKPTTKLADSPSGLNVDLHVPQGNLAAPTGQVSAHLRDSTVELPEGLVVNPSSANGLDACSPAQVGLTSGPGVTPITYTPDAADCPDASKLGSVEVDTPVLDHSAPGAVYIAEPYNNPFDSLLALYIAIDDPQSGVVAKLAGEVQADPVTGQLTATFEENPQLPFEDLKVHFFGGAGGSLRTPSTCGTYATVSSLTPWSAPDSGPPVTTSDAWTIEGSASGGPCATTEAALPNAPLFSPGTVSPVAGAKTPLVVNLHREDGSQQFSSVTLTPPQGLVGKLAGIPYCPDSSLADAAAKSGKAEEASPSCPPASYVGGVTAAAGAGPAPYYASGRAYLTGPYKGAPLSLAIVTPATAGPFDLGTIVVRTALYVDRKTAQIKAVSDPIPTILQGIPLDVRSVQVRMDRPDFTLNPTSCEPMSFGGQLLSTQGQVAQLQSRFQVGGCEQLGFRPRISLSLKGGTARGKYPALTAVLRPREGDANISSVSVALPHSEFLAQEHIRTVCTRVQFAADACPRAAIYGTATVTTPLLDYPLTGPVYLRSSDNLLPDLVPDLRGPAHQPLKLESAGRTDSVRGGIRNTFDFVPDAPFTKFVLQMQGGKKGLLVNSRDICKQANKAIVKFSAHSGAALEARPVLKTDCGKKKKHSRHKG